MTLDFPSRYESVEFPFGFYVLNYTSRILTAKDRRYGERVDLQMVPIPENDLHTVRNLIAEIETRGKLKHKNLLPWLHLFPYKDENNLSPSLVFSFPISPVTLLDLVGYFPVCPWPLTHDKISWIVYQLLSVLHYMHCCGQAFLHLPLRYIHLADDGSYDLQLQDFGWKYPCFGENICADDVRQCLRFSYKWNGFSVLAPEVLANMFTVDKSADMWNLGCVLAMLLSRGSLSDKYPKPVLCCPGDDSLEAAADFLGTPPTVFYDQLTRDKKIYFPTEFKSRKPIEGILLKEVEVIPAGPLHPTSSSKQASNLLERLLSYPSERIDPEEAMTHSYFSSYYTEDDVKRNKDNAFNIPSIRKQFNEFESYECEVRLHQSVMSSELRQPLEVYSLQEMCLKTIESSHTLAYIQKMRYPKSLVKLLVERAESFVQS